MNRKKLNFIFISIFAAITLAVVIPACSSPSDSDEISWQLIWSDEFEGAANLLPDSTKWAFDIGTGWGNAQLEYDTKRPENISLDGTGNLVFTARKEIYMGQNYTSARINTKGLFTTTYGKIEARMKLPWGQGMWPAFWMLGSDIDSVVWPGCGEIDIMEYRGQQPTRVHGSLHGPGYSGSKAKTKSFELINDRFDLGYHTFKLEWGNNIIKWFVDDQLYQMLTPSDVAGEWVYNKSFYVILNLAVGGGYVGSPNDATVFPQKMLVDWIRVYKGNL